MSTYNHTIGADRPHLRGGIHWARVMQQTMSLADYPPDSLRHIFLIKLNEISCEEGVNVMLWSLSIFKFHFQTPIKTSIHHRNSPLYHPFIIPI